MYALEYENYPPEVRGFVYTPFTLNTFPPLFYKSQIRRSLSFYRNNLTSLLIP